MGECRAEAEHLDVLRPAKFPSIERRAGRYITAPLVAAFTKQGAFCLFHDAHSRSVTRQPASKYPLHPLLKSIHRWHRRSGSHFSCFMGEVAHCRFTRQHASGQLTAGTYPPVSVDVALAAALNRQRWAERTAKSTGTVWATQERAKQTKGRSHPCNARVIRVGLEQGNSS